MAENSIHSLVIQYLVKIQTSQALVPPTLSYTFNSASEVSFDSACFYIFDATGTAEFVSNDVATFLRIPQDSVLRESFCRDTEICLLSVLEYSIEVDRVIYPVSLDSTASYTFTPNAPTLVLLVPPITYFFGNSAPIVYRVIGSGSVKNVYSLEVAASLETPYTIPQGVTASLVQFYGMSVTTSLTQDLLFTTTIGAATLETLYDLELYKLIVSTNKQLYGTLVSAELVNQYSLNSKVTSILAAPYGDLITVFVGSEQPYDLQSVTPIFTTNIQPYTLLTTSQISSLLSDSVVMRVDNAVIEIQDVTLDLSEGAFAWTVDLQIRNSEAYAKLPVNKEFVLDVLGTEFSFIVDTRAISRGELASNLESLQITGISPTIVLQAPRAAPYSKVWEVTTTAKTIAQEILQNVGFTGNLEWKILDWSIPGYRVSIDSGNPIAVIQDLAAAAAATVTTNPSGDLVVQKLFKEWPENWNSDNKDHSVNEMENIFSVEETEEVTDFYNSVRVQDLISSTQDSLVWEALEDINDQLSGNLLVYLAPYRSGTSLVTTGGATIISKTTEFREYEEDVEIVKGRGAVAQAIYEILDVAWYEKVLGGLSFEQYSTNVTTNTTDPISYTVIRIKYKSKVDVYKIRYTKTVPPEESIPSQFLLMED